MRSEPTKYLFDESIGFWFRTRESVDSTRTLLAATVDNGIFYGFQLGRDSTNFIRVFFHFDGATELVLTTNEDESAVFNDGNWHRVQLDRIHRKFRFSIDENPQISANFPSRWDFLSNFFVGAELDFLPDGGFSGSIGDVRFASTRKEENFSSFCFQVEIFGEKRRVALREENFHRAEFLRENETIEFESSTRPLVFLLEKEIFFRQISLRFCSAEKSFFLFQLENFSAEEIFRAEIEENLLKISFADRQNGKNEFFLNATKRNRQENFIEIFFVEPNRIEILFDEKIFNKIIFKSFRFAKFQFAKIHDAKENFLGSMRDVKFNEKPIVQIDDLRPKKRPLNNVCSFPQRQS